MPVTVNVHRHVDEMAAGGAALLRLVVGQHAVLDVLRADLASIGNAHAEIQHQFEGEARLAAERILGTIARDMRLGPRLEAAGLRLTRGLHPRTWVGRDQVLAQRPCREMPKGFQPVALCAWRLVRDDLLHMAAPQRPQLADAVLGAELLDDRLAQFARGLGLLLPVIAAEIADDRCLDTASHDRVCALRHRALTLGRCLVSGHELRRPWQAFQRHARAAVLAEVVARFAIAIDETIDIGRHFQLHVRVSLLRRAPTAPIGRTFPNRARRWKRFHRPVPLFLRIAASHAAISSSSGAVPSASPNCITTLPSASNLIARTVRPALRACSIAALRSRCRTMVCVLPLRSSQMRVGVMD
ncbi:hypothetical protein ABIF66_005009 [Bradyrhizobium japonicum]